MKITRQNDKLLEAAEAIRLDPDKEEAAYMARQLVQATLPHKNPGNVPAWSRTNGNLTLGIQPGWDFKKKKTIGFPYGTLPRLLLFWITTEAVRTKTPRLELGNSFTSFMKQLNLESDSGGERGNGKRLRDQMQRLFQAKISFHQTHESKKGNKGDTWQNMDVAPKGTLWWDEKNPDQSALWGSWIQLGEDFYKAITEDPVPVDMRALMALKKSPLALDLYSWATYTAYRTQKNGQSRSISWENLHEQLGAEYKDIKEFARKVRLAFKKIQPVYRDLSIEFEKGGVKILPCNPAITVRRKRIKTANI